MTRSFTITLKIPDNAAYTALTALQRLGFDIAHVERSEVWIVDDGGDPDTFIERIAKNETIFNLNKHRITDLGVDQPRPGEVWIMENGKHDAIRGFKKANRYVGWRLMASGGAPVDTSVVRDAAERLLCNPAVETSIFEERR